MSGAITATTVAAVVGATAAVVGTGVAVHKGAMAKKEQDRQKSIAADNQSKQAAEIAKQKGIEKEKKRGLDLELEKKQRAEAEAGSARASEGETRKRQTRGRRSLISGSAVGMKEEDKLA